MAIHGTLFAEAGVLRTALKALGVTEKQIVQANTGLGLGRAPTAAELQETADQLRSELEKLEAETLDDFVAKNKVIHTVPPIFLMDGELVPVRDQDLLQILRDRDGWDRFRSVYPQSSGLVMFSRIGFNAAVTQALVFAGKQMDKTKSQGGYSLFEKDDEGRWQNIGTALAWDS